MFLNSNGHFLKRTTHKKVPTRYHKEKPPRAATKYKGLYTIEHIYVLYRSSCTHGNFSLHHLTAEGILMYGSKTTPRRKGGK